MSALTHWSKNRSHLDKRRDGLGFGLHGDDPLSFFLIDEPLAYGNPSTEHCFQVHNNALMMINAIASAAQIVGASELGEPYDTNRNH